MSFDREAVVGGVEGFGQGDKMEERGGNGGGDGEAGSSAGGCRGPRAARRGLLRRREGPRIGAKEES